MESMSQTFGQKMAGKNWSTDSFVVESLTEEEEVVVVVVDSKTK